MIVPQNVINQIHKVEFSLFEPLSTTTLWAYPIGQSYDYRIFLSGQWTSVADDAGGSLSELIQRAELAIKAAVSATEGAENVNATLIGNTLTVTDREGKTTSITLSGTEGGGYEPPVGGIPKTDLASGVQASLDKADTALQSFTESDPTVPSWAKQSNKPIYTAQEVGALPSDTPLFSGDYNDLDNKPNLATVATSGSYNDLSNKPTIPDAQIQSDWNQDNTSAKDFIKNKPDLTAYVQKSQTAGLLKNDGSVDTNTYLTQHQDISGKEDNTIIIAPVNQTDATAPITSLACELNKYYRIDVPIETLTITLPAMTDLTTVRTVVVYLTAGTAPAVTIAAADSKDVYYQDGYEIEAGGTYEVNCLWNGEAWIVGSIEVDVS